MVQSNNSMARQGVCSGTWTKNSKMGNEGKRKDSGARREMEKRHAGHLLASSMTIHQLSVRSLAWAIPSLYRETPCGIATKSAIAHLGRGRR